MNTFWGNTTWLGLITGILVIAASWAWKKYVRKADWQMFVQDVVESKPWLPLALTVLALVFLILFFISIFTPTTT